MQAGFQTHFESQSEDLKVRAHGKLIWQRLSATEVLIIDEISLFENLRFERLNVVMNTARNCENPFGGVQMVVTGDWCQLTPVCPSQHCITCGKDMEILKASYWCLDCDTWHFREDKWAFRSQAWSQCDFLQINLSQVHRQKDPIFVKILDKHRLGKAFSCEEQRILLHHVSDTTKAVKLLPTRDEVAFINETAFEQLTEPILHYMAFDDFECKHEELRGKGDRLSNGLLNALAEHMLAYNVDLRVDTIVVFLANLDIAGQLVNGSEGTVIGFEAHNDRIMPEQGGRYIGRKQSLIGGFVSKIQDKRWPVVRFTDGRESTIHPVSRINELGYTEPYSLISRTQIPLITTWALTIHKAQGMTLDKVIVNLSRTFEEGQAYVALSRA